MFCEIVLAQAGLVRWEREIMCVIVQVLDKTRSRAVQSGFCITLHQYCAGFHATVENNNRENDTIALCSSDFT